MELAIEYPPSRNNLEKIHQELERAVRRVSLCRALSKDRWDDIVQEAWLRITRNIERQGKKRTLNRGFFRRAVYNIVVEILQKEGRLVPDEETVVEAVDRGQTPAMTRPEPGLERRIWARQRWHRVRNCLTGLCASQRRVVQLVCIEGHSVAQAAAILEWSYLKTDRCLYNGRKNLRQCCDE